MKTLVSIAAIAVCAITWTGCSTSGSTPSSSSSRSLTDSTRIPVTLSIVVPTRTSTTKRPAFISSGTQSATFSAYFSAASATVTVPCTTSCSATLDVPVGQVSFGVTLYGSQAGEVLGVGSQAVTIADGQNNPVAITVEANEVSAAMASSATTVHVGQSTTLTLTATATDASGETITGSDAYLVPITLSSSGSGASAFSLASTSLTSPASSAMLTYDGGGSAGQTVTIAPAIAQPFTPTLTPVTISIAQ